MLNYFSKNVGIDLGTANSIIYLEGANQRQRALQMNFLIPRFLSKCKAEKLRKLLLRKRRVELMVRLKTEEIM